jgi:hypothetical protein
VKFLGELLFHRNRDARDERDACKFQPVASPDNFRGPDNGIADSDIEMEFREDSPGQRCDGRVSGTSFRSAVQIHLGKADGERKIVAHVRRRPVLKVFQYVAFPLNFSRE